MHVTGSTKTKWIIAELTRQNQRLAIINQIAKSINVRMSYEDIINQMAAPLKGVISYDLLSFCLLENNNLVIKASIPKDPKLLGVGTVLHNYNSAPWQAVKHKQCYLRQDIWHETHKYQEDDHLRTIGIKSAIMAPLLVKNEVIGTLNLGSQKAYAYSEKDFVFVQQLADQLAVCIQNSQLYNEVFKAKKEWEQTFKAVPDLIILMDPARTVLQVNNHINGKKPRELVGKNCWEILPFCNNSCATCPVEITLNTGESISREINLPSSNRILNIFTYPVLNEVRAVQSMVIYIVDVTSKKQMEAQLFQSAKLAAIGEMAAGAAHELNSPLTAVIGNANILLRRADPQDKTYKLLQDIKKCGQRCKSIIQNLLTFARQDTYIFEPVNINEVVENSLSLVAYQIQKCGITIDTELTPNIPPITGNGRQLEQVIINFLLNARDALDGMEEQKIVVTTGMKEREGVPVVEVSVADTGTGIEPQHLEYIFNPFFTTKKETRGTGLGLSVSLGIAEAHGGTIEVESSPGFGSKFSLILPCK